MRKLIRQEAIKNSDIDQVISLHNLNHNGKRTKKDWVWEYQSCYPESHVFTVIKEGDKIVGTQGMIPVYINVKGVKCLSGKSENSLLAFQHRGSSLFKELYGYAINLCKEKNVHLIWGITPAIKVWKDKLGFSVYSSAKCSSVLILNPCAFVNKIFHSKWSFYKRLFFSLSIIPIYLYSCARWLRKLKSPGTQFSYKIEKQPRSTIDLNRLFERLTEKTDFIYIEQDEKFLNWRVYGNPNIKYSTYFLYKNNDLCGYCYFYMNQKKEVYLTDFTFDDHVAGDFLLRKLLERLRSDKAVSITYMGNIKNSLISQVFVALSKYGFIKRRDSDAFVLLNLSRDDEEYLYDIRNWYINGLWTEGYMQ